MIKKILIFLDRILARISIFLLKIYQYTLSPDKGIFSLWLKGRVCAHEPHCSEYAVKTLRRYGFFRGIGKVVHRVSSCKPSYSKQYDPEYYKVVFMSSAPIGVPFLQKLNQDKRFDLVGIVTNPDEKSGRGMKMKENIIKAEGKKIAPLIKGAGNSPLILGLGLPDRGVRGGKILLLDGLGGDGTSNRFPWLKKELTNQGYIVYNPCLPNYDNPNLDEQVDFLIKEYGNIIDENTIIIGHSLGALLSNHFVTKLGKPIKQLIHVGPTYFGKDQEILAKKYSFIKDVLDSLKEYHSKEFNTNKLEELSGDFTIMLSNNDPYIPLEKAKKYYKKTFKNIQIQEFKNKGHFNESFGISKLPEILSEIFSGNPKHCGSDNFIQTPKSLNLKSKKYGEQAKSLKVWLESKKPDYLVVIAYGKIIPQYILDIPNIAPINVHGSILPEYRGASPIQSIFLDNKEESGITIMKMDATMDTGNIIDIKKIKVPFDRTSLDLIEKMKKIGPRFLNNTIRNYGKKIIGEIEQDEKKATYCNKIEKTYGEIDPWKDSVQDVYNKYRAYYLRPKVYFKAPLILGLETSDRGVGGGKSFIIEHLQLDQKLFESNKNKPIISPFSKGGWGGLLNPCVTKISIKPEGKKSMDWTSFVNGYLK